MIARRFPADPVNDVAEGFGTTNPEGLPRMTYDLLPSEDLDGAARETSEYRLTHYRVYDENGFSGAFATTPPENATLASVSAYLCAKFAGTGGTGFGSKDLVVLLGARIVAVVRKGADGRPEVTTFET